MTVDIFLMFLLNSVAQAAVGAQKETDMLLVAMRDLINARSKPQSARPQGDQHSGASQPNDHSLGHGERPAEDPGFIPARV